MSEPDLHQVAIDNFREYLRIKTVHPNPNYTACLEFLKRMAHELKLEFRTFEFKSGIPTVLMTWRGLEDDIKSSILLSSHYDVVPVSEEFWESDPFGAEMRPNGDIVARGSQDMKCVGMAYLEAIRRLKARGSILQRTLHLLFTPDEEIGSANGAAQFCSSEELKNLNIGVCFDEGIPSPVDKYYVFNCERSTTCIKIVARGCAGHGSSLPQGTAIEKLLMVLNKFSQWRKEESEKLITLNGDLGRVNSINITMLSAGKQHNVIPDVAEATVDIRLSPEFSLANLEAKVNEFTSISGVSWTFFLKHDSSARSSVDENDCFWREIRCALEESGVDYEIKVFPGGTDSRFYRAQGLPAYGISPFRNTPILLHDHNEFLNSNVFLEGIQFYVRLLEKVGNLP